MVFFIWKTYFHSVLYHVLYFCLYYVYVFNGGPQGRLTNNQLCSLLNYYYYYYYIKHRIWDTSLHDKCNECKQHVAQWYTDNVIISLGKIPLKLDSEYVAGNITFKISTEYTRCDHNVF